MGTSAGAVQLEECPTTGTKHLQWHLTFKNARTLLSVRKKLEGHHVDVSVDPFTSWCYCTSTGRHADKPRLEGPVTWGVQPKPAKVRGSNYVDHNRLIRDTSIRDLVDEGIIPFRDV